MPGAQHLGVERLAGGDQAAQRRERAQLRALGDHAVLGRGHAERVDLLAREHLEPLVRVEARVVQQRGGAPQPRGDEHVARGLRPARGGRAPRQAVGRGREPVLGLHVLAGQVALAVQHRLRLARRAAREGDEARVLVAELDRGERARPRSAQRRGRRARRRPAPPRRARRGCARRTRSAAAGRSRAGRAGRPAAAARCRAARRRRSGSTRASRAPTRAGCRRASSPRPRAGPRGQRALPRRGPRPPRPRRSSTQSASRRARARRAPAARAGRRRPRRGRSSSGVERRQVCF